MATTKKELIFLGATPPPYMGPTLATNVILSSRLNNEFTMIHLNTSDHRGLTSLGKRDLKNLCVAFKHYLILFWLIVTKRPSLVYIPISQTSLGYFRDAGFILISKLFNRKVICHLRGGNFLNWYNSLHRLGQRIVYRIHNLVDGQIVLGEKLKNLFLYILPSEKIFVVPNGKNIEINYLKKKQSEKIKVLFLSNFIREKGILDVLRAASLIYQHYKDIEAIFAGSWMDQNTRIEFEKILNENFDLPINIIGPVYEQAKYDLLLSSDIFIFPTYYPAEGHPWVIVEAMAAGLPIITTDQGAITESVIDGVNGFIVEKRNPRQIAEKIKFLIENSDIRKKMGEESQRIYLEKFTEDKMIERLSRAFNSVLSN